MSFRRAVVLAAALVAGAAMAQDATQPPAAAPASTTAAATTASDAAKSSAAGTSDAKATAKPATDKAKPKAEKSGIPEFLTGDPKAGKKKAVVCGACHGIDGNSASAEFPKLASQNAHYIVEQLKKFKSGERKNAIMLGMATPLTQQDRLDIAAYFSRQKIQPGVADETLVKHGKQLFRGGDVKRGIPACAACHEPDGAGNPGAPYPHLAGQHADYIQKMLTNWKNGDVWGKDKHDQIMPAIAKKLSKKDIAALASFIEGLHTNTGSTPAVATTKTASDAKPKQ